VRRRAQPQCYHSCSGKNRYRVDVNSDAMITARGMGISFGDEQSPSERQRPIALDKNHNAALSDGTGGALWLPVSSKLQIYYLPSYRRRDATALGLLLLSI
jgi:hypothetical protein